MKRLVLIISTVLLLSSCDTTPEFESIYSIGENPPWENSSYNEYSVITNDSVEQYKLYISRDLNKMVVVDGVSKSYIKAESYTNTDKVVDVPVIALLVLGLYGFIVGILTAYSNLD